MGKEDNLGPLALQTLQNNSGNNPKEIQSSLGVLAKSTLNSILPSSPYANTEVVTGQSRVSSPEDIKAFGEYNVNRQFSAGDPFEQLGQNQSNIEKIWNGTERLVGTTLTKFAGGIGYIGGFGDYAINGFDDISRMTDNVWSAKFAEYEENLKDFAPIYTPTSVSEGDIFGKMSSTSWWMDQGVDGAAFMFSSIIPGAIIGKAGLGMKLAGAGAKAVELGAGLEKGIKTANYLSKVNLAKNIDLTAATVYNTVIEAGIEAKGVQDNIRNSYEQELLNGTITVEEVEERAAKAASDTFKLNSIVLAVPNFIEQKMFFGQLGKSGDVMKRLFNAETGALIEGAEKFTKRELVANMGKAVGLGVLREGFWEENVQLAIQNYEQIKGRGEDYKDGTINADSLENIAKGMYDNLFTDEGQESIFLGAVMGLAGGAVGAVREKKQERLIINNAKEYLKNNIDTYNTNLKADIQDVFVKDKDGNIQKDPQTGKPIIDEIKAGELMAKVIAKSQDEQIKNMAAITGVKDLYDFIKHKQFVEYVLPFLSYEGGLDVVNAQIDNMSEEQLKDQKEVNEGFGEAFNIQEVKQKLKEKAKETYENYQNINNRTGAWNFAENKEESKIFTSFLQNYQSELAQRTSTMEFLRGKADEAVKELNLLNVKLQNRIYYNTDSEKTLEQIVTPEEREERDRLEKKAEQYTKQLKQKIKDYGEVNTKKALKERWEKLKGKAAEQDEIINKSATEASQASTQEQDKARAEQAEKAGKAKDPSKNLVDNQLKEEIAAEQEEAIAEGVIASNKKDQTEGNMAATEEESEESGTFEDMVNRAARTSQSIPEDTANKNSEESGEEAYNPRPEEYEEKLNTSEEKLEEDEDKVEQPDPASHVFSLAYKLMESSQTKSGRYKRTGEVNPEADERLFDPEFLKEGEELILYIDTQHPDYEKYKDDLNNMPIAVIKKSDYLAGNKNPFSYIHRTEWYSNNPNIEENQTKALAEETKDFRNKIFQNRGRGGEVIPYSVLVVDKSLGRLNTTKDQHSVFSLSDNPQIVVAKYDAVIGTDYEGAIVGKLVDGVPYVLVKAPNGKMFAKYLKTYKIGNTNIGNEIADTIHTLLHEHFSKQGNSTILRDAGIRDFKDIEREIKKFVYFGNRTANSIDIRKTFYATEEGVVTIGGKSFDLTKEHDIEAVKAAIKDLYISVNTLHIQDKVNAKFSYLTFNGEKLIRNYKPYKKFLDESGFITMNAKANFGTIFGNYVTKIDSTTLKPFEESIVDETPVITPEVTPTTDTKADIDLISTPVSKIVEELSKLKTLNEKLDWLKNNNLLSSININGKEYNTIDYSDRVIVLMKVGKYNIPFYISTGQAGKKAVKAGNWYAVFGIGVEKGWINKGSEEQINNNYGFPVFEKLSKILNEGIGTIQSREDNGNGKLKDGIGFLSDSKSDLEAFNNNMNLPTKPAGDNTKVKEFYDHVNNTINLINEELKELSAVSTSTKPSVSVSTDTKADIERRRQEGENPNGDNYKGTTKEKDGLKVTTYESFTKEGKKRTASGRQMSVEDFIKEYNISEEDATLLKETEYNRVTIREVRDSNGKFGISIIAHTADNLKAELEVVGKYDAELAALGTTNTKAEIERRERVADIITSQLELGAALPEILDKLAEQGYVEKINNSAFFKQSVGRDAVVFNIDGAIVPVYRSSKGTSSKTKGEWYPFFFNGGDWLVKAGADTYKDGYNNPIIKQILDSLNKNYKYDKSLAKVEGNNEELLSLLPLGGLDLDVSFEDNSGIYDFQNYIAIAVILKDWQSKLGNIDVSGYQDYLDGASSSLIKTNPTLKSEIEKAFKIPSDIFAELAALEAPIVAKSEEKLYIDSTKKHSFKRANKQNIVTDKTAEDKKDNCK